MNRHVLIVCILTGIAVFLSYSHRFGIKLSIFEIVIIVGLSAIIFVTAIWYNKTISKIEAVK